MSMMQILGAFAKNLLEDKDQSRQETFEEKKCNTNCSPPTVVHYPEVCCQRCENLRLPYKRRHSVTKKNKRHLSKEVAQETQQEQLVVRPRLVKKQDIHRIANKVTNSIAAHIDRMVKRRQQLFGSVYRPYTTEYRQAPFRFGSNSLWNQPKSSIKSQKTLLRCQSCKSALKPRSPNRKAGKDKPRSLSTVKDTPKKDKENKKKKLKQSIVCFNRPLEVTRSKLVLKPKKIWAKELFDEFQERAIKEKLKDSEILKKEKGQIKQRLIDPGKRHSSNTKPLENKIKRESSQGRAKSIKEMKS